MHNSRGLLMGRRRWTDHFHRRSPIKSLLAFASITVNADIMLKFKGNLKIDCEKHIMMTSGHQKKDTSIDPRTPYSIWLNPEFDEKGNPVPEYDIEVDKVEHICQG